MTSPNGDCENCGMIDVPLADDCCEGCHCDRCGRSAFEAGCSMNDMGWCDDCESLLSMTDSERKTAIAMGIVPPIKQVNKS